MSDIDLSKITDYDPGPWCISSWWFGKMCNVFQYERICINWNEL